ncbi:uncharacterized protein Nmag_2747 [Natrialba magadii ATCC 43099]|uniref:Uncharacterized protein n=1 Tax=Natrialba magadii (strain ATCC 43099 / DSM 3394 / CCM 3739 / CIP 104546 / IAM 13178 / JCM 8861 / NBRC 102185 / NCIMB 2190 / MS3) TaxID=547559 RepID=D3SZP3_NATMM|nr:hypothetical protein [Natrialba magadii]ADD06303.1 uncharacterized protein Nmag_2747 [Natrialba magadii ATCC 43099]ELY31260.1 hypothetical protein C500_06651 [Natrialba magadii ATCC 43099]
MDVVQIALGTILLAVSGLVLAGPSILETNAGGYPVAGVVAGAALAVGAIAVVLDLARSTPS